MDKHRTTYMQTDRERQRDGETSQKHTDGHTHTHTRKTGTQRHRHLSPSSFLSFLHQKTNSPSRRLDLRLFRFRLDSSLSELPGSAHASAQHSESAQPALVFACWHGAILGEAHEPPGEQGEVMPTPSKPNPELGLLFCRVFCCSWPGRRVRSGCVSQMLKRTFLKRWRLASTMPLICSPTCQRRGLAHSR